MSETIYVKGRGINFSEIEKAAANQRHLQPKDVIIKLLTNKGNWIESERASLFWDGSGWSVNKMVEGEDDFIIHEYEEEELDKAIEQFIEHTLDDRMTKTDEEILYEQDIGNN